MSKATVKYPELQSILNDTGIPYFLMAVSHLMDIGYRNMTDENVKETIEEIKKQDDTRAIMTNDFMVFIVEAAYRISQAARPMDIIKFTNNYISK